MSRGRARTVERSSEKVERMELGGMELGAKIETDGANIHPPEKMLPRPRPFS